MNICVNGSKTNYQPPFPLTWGKFFSELHNDYIVRNHGIVKVLLDGKESLSSIKKYPDVEVPRNIKKVEIFTKDTFSITKEGFSKVFTLTDSIRCEIPLMVDYYRTGQIKIASVKIKKVLETIKPMIDFVNSVGINFSLNFDEVCKGQDITLRKKISLFLKSFSNLVILQKKENNLEIADYLEGQFSEDISKWNKIIKQLLREISEMPRR